jgi:hypothetical protein
MTATTAADIISCFNRLFSRSHNVELVGGASEPLYLPPTAQGPALIAFSHDYVNSALHEVAHWCIAGARRRRRRDYGYWYQPPPRDETQQQAFAAVEARVQALEAVFAQAAGLDFRVSIDDVENLTTFEPDFSRLVAREVERWRRSGLPERARVFCQALAAGADDRLATGGTGG